MADKTLAEIIRQKMTPRRHKHTLDTAATAIRLAKQYGADPAKAEVAALLHDIAREYSDSELIEICRKYNIHPNTVEKAVPKLLHGKIGAYIAKEEYSVADEEILNAIIYHTTGREHMSLLEKIVFLADMIEPGRNFPGIELIREAAQRDLDSAVLMSLDSTISFVLDRRQFIHPDSVHARNYLLEVLGVSN